MARWFVPPIVVPVFLVICIVLSALHRMYL